MYIYIITNKLNSKQYVGQTKHSIQKRFTRHCWNSEYKKNMPICLAIKKHGKTNFSIKELQQCLSQEELDKAELNWARKLDTFSPNGYNLKAGAGRGSCSEETKKKISQANKGRKVSEETRKRLSESHKGFKVTEETKRKLSIINRGRCPSPQTIKASIEASAKHYDMISPDGEIVHIYNMRQFCKDRDLRPSKMSNVVTGKRNHHKGWRIES